MTEPQKPPLQGRYALVTGATAGLGLAVAGESLLFGQGPGVHDHELAPPPVGHVADRLVPLPGRQRLGLPDVPPDTF